MKTTIKTEWVVEHKEMGRWQPHGRFTKHQSIKQLAWRLRMWPRTVCRRVKETTTTTVRRKVVK